MKKYDHKAIEEKWQKRWEEEPLSSAEDLSDKKKYYVLDMFPYPSGAGLHVGHVVGYTATDIVARYKKALGFNVLHPMGWDSFGLPAEQYAIRTGTHPADTTRDNIANYKRQLKRLGLGYDWDREVATSNPRFYKWTQWIFTELYKKGLAYEAEILVNYCPALGTVLSNEEVAEGKSVEGGYPVERRPLRQWVLRITEYAERLLKDLETVDWPERIKRLQANWIGKSEGALITFDGIDVFTTCPHTLPGATFLVLAPEHPIVDQLATNISEVKAYREQAARKSDLERTDLAKEKTGVFTGAYATNPYTGKEIPIWVADYVLMGYGTGAIMAVPHGDERDREFAEKFNLPIVECDLDPKHIPKMISWLEKEGKGKAQVNYKMRDWLFSRQRYWGEPIPIIHHPDGTKESLPLNDLPLLPPEVADYQPTGEGLSPLAKVSSWTDLPDGAKRETNTMPQWAGSCWYYLRFCDPHNEEAFCAPEKEKYWLPVDLYIGGAEHAVLHLLYARFWHKVLHDLGHVSTSEPFAKLFNQGLINSRSYRRRGGEYISPEEVEPFEGGYVLKESGEELISNVEKMSKSKLNVVNPDEMVESYGADALRLYEMFMGPLDKDKVWNTDSVSGCRRFLSRLYDLVQNATDETTEEALKLGHRLVDGVTRDIENLHFNTAIAKMMEFVNGISRTTPSKSVLRMALQVLAPFAPHIAAELWEQIGEGDLSSWPKADSKYLQEDQITYVVQVNGKVRGRFDLPKDQDQETIVSLAKENERLAVHLNGEIKKVIFVPNKLLNFVVQ